MSPVGFVETKATEGDRVCSVSRFAAKSQVLTTIQALLFAMCTAMLSFVAMYD